MEAAKPPQLMNFADLGEYLKLSRSAIYQLLRSKKDPLPSVKLGKVRRFQVEKIQWWVEKHEQ